MPMPKVKATDFNDCEHSSLERPKVSIIIPTLQEENTIERTLLSLQRQGNGYEVIVVDGGSSDSSVDIASRHARVIKGPCGRARQMNLGASHARAGILLFLHADTILPEGAVEKVSKVMEGDGVVGGFFRLEFDPPHPFLHLLSLFARMLSLAPYGDHTLFVSAKAFKTLRGYKDISIMEDLEFYRRLKRLGKVRLIQDPVTTSSRRFLKKGIYRQNLLNILICLGYECGLKPDRLKSWYKEIR